MKFPRSYLFEKFKIWNLDVKRDEISNVGVLNTFLACVLTKATNLLS